MGAQKIENDPLLENTSPGTEERNSEQTRERRKQLLIARGDRRVILRFTDTNMRMPINQMLRVTKLGIPAACIYGCGLVALNISNGIRASLGSIVLFATLLFVVYRLHKLKQALESYAKSESQAKLVTVVEQSWHVLFTIIAMGIILGTGHLIQLL